MQSYYMYCEFTERNQLLLNLLREPVELHFILGKKGLIFVDLFC